MPSSLETPVDLGSFTLIETIDPGELDRKRTVSATAIVACLVGGAIVVALVTVFGGFEPQVAGWMYACIAGPMLLIGAVSALMGKAEFYRRVVHYRDGFVTYRTKDKEETHGLHECCWYPGRPWDDRTLKQLALRGRAILIVFPSGQDIACGLTPDKYEAWQQLLKSSACGRVHRFDGWFALIAITLFFAGLALGALGGWHGGVIVRDAIIPIAGNNVVVKLLPAAAAVILACLGALLPVFLIPGYRRGTQEEKNRLRFGAIKISVLGGGGAGMEIGGNVVIALVFVAFLAGVVTLMTSLLFKMPVRHLSRS